MSEYKSRISYFAGANVHPTQASLAMQAVDTWEQTVITNIGPGTVTLTTAGRVESFRCDHAPRLRDLMGSGRVPTTATGELAAVLVARYSLLLVPHAEPGQPLPTRMAIHAGVTAFDRKEGATSSPSEGGSWALFSIGRLTAKAVPPAATDDTGPGGGAPGRRMGTT